MKKVLATALSLSVIFSAATAPLASAVTPPVPSPVQTNANVGQALEIAPPVVDLKADPGQKIQTQISLRDISPSALLVKGTIDDFEANGDNGVPKVLINQTEPSPYSIKTWVAPIAPLTLKSKQIQALPLTITVPKDAAPGGYYGVVRFTVTTPDMQDTGVSLNASLGALIFLRVSGTAKEAMTTDSFYATKDSSQPISLFESAPVEFVVKAKNTGNVFERPTGQIVVSDMFGNAIANVNVNLDQRTILQGSTRKFDKLMLDNTNIGDRFLFGMYHAKLALAYGNQQTTTAELTFWVIPWKLILIALLALVAIVIGLRLAIKRYTDRVVGRSRGSRRR